MDCPIHPGNMLTAKNGAKWCVAPFCGYIYNPAQPPPLPHPFQALGQKVATAAQKKITQPLPALSYPDPGELFDKRAVYQGEGKYKCWSNRTRWDGCADLFDFGTKECPNCGRGQRYDKGSIKPVSAHRCTVCRNELSSWLDAYYGKDEEEAKKCSGCRK
jgi:hypothetical protein